MTRDLSEVIARILTVVPESQAGLRLDLYRVRSSALFAAPEMQPMFWDQAAEILRGTLVDVPAPGWPMEVARIFGGQA